VTYDPRTHAAATFSEATVGFAHGSDTPSAFLQRCIDRIEAHEATVQAFAALNLDGARLAAQASDRRWRSGAPLSPIDGMPIGIKDLLETKDMPTQFGCAAYEGNFPKRDNAAVRALRDAGAVILGKTVTAELGGTHPGPTTNPFDPTRTPGGSSSGSAAAVAAGMVAAAIGTQVAGSIIRPAGFCGNIAIKPSQGAVNRGERQATSMSTHGVHANGFDDMWRVITEIARRAGGDPGHRPLAGPDDTPAPQRPSRLVVLETEGWRLLDDTTRDAFEQLLGQLRAAGVELVRRTDHFLVESLELALRRARRIAVQIICWENRWSYRNLVDESPDLVSFRTKQALAIAEQMTVADYHDALRARDVAQASHRAAGEFADATITLACPGPAPLWLGDRPGEEPARSPTGDVAFNVPSSLLFAPAVAVPLLAVNGLPVGVQLMGLPGSDARTVAHANWLHTHLQPVFV
jgi:Asp-tRNA(Asn)/Glu-tRNA(Gln) amidotransferase A subunit family amidase